MEWKNTVSVEKNNQITIFNNKSYFNCFNRNFWFQERKKLVRHKRTSFFKTIFAYWFVELKLIAKSSVEEEEGHHQQGDS